MDFAGKLQEFVFRMLADSLRSRVEPVAAALDGRPSAATLEEGRRDAGTRAGRIGDALASGRGVADAYLAARALLQDLWAVAAEDAVAAARWVP